MEDNKEYYAFISYKREDKKWARAKTLYIDRGDGDEKVGVNKYTN